MTDSMNEPTTEAGRALAAKAKLQGWSNWEGLAQFTIPAIEREAAARAAGITDEQAEQWLKDNDIIAVTHWHDDPTCAECLAAERAAPVDARAAGIDAPTTEAACPKCGHDTDHTTACPEGCPLCIPPREAARAAGIDAERLAEAIRNTYIAPSASRLMDAENIIAEYARIAAEKERP